MEDNKEELLFEKNIEETYCDEEDILNECEDDFGYQIKERGKYYYESGHIINIYKDGNKYYAKVRGTKDEPYIVTVQNNEYEVEYECNCPYEYPCKHEYAVLKAISNKEYNDKKLKQAIKKHTVNIKEIIKLVPPEELKKYIIETIDTNFIHFDQSTFEEYFRNYIPVEDYEYYYNNLYNSLIIGRNEKETISDYLYLINQYIKKLNFEESFKIIKSIIEAYIDTNKINNDDNIDYLLKIGIYLRVTYRKCNQNLKEIIKEWIKKLENNNFYNNFYLEDIIIQINIENNR